MHWAQRYYVKLNLLSQKFLPSGCFGFKLVLSLKTNFPTFAATQYNMVTRPLLHSVLRGF